jgi:hypothetical protein
MGSKMLPSGGGAGRGATGLTTGISSYIVLAVLKEGAMRRLMSCGGALALGMAFGAVPVLAEDVPFQMPAFSARDMVPLVHGPNWVDLDGDGHKDLVVKSRVTINSAHSFSDYSFHVFAKYKNNNPENVELLEPGINWYTVTFPDKAPPLGRLYVASHQGVDCILHDYRLVRTKTKSGFRQTYLIEAQRESGESYADAADVEFIFYRFDIASERASNQFAFVRQGSVRAKGQYCSVDNAFKKELGLPIHDHALEGYDLEPEKQ